MIIFYGMYNFIAHQYPDEPVLLNQQTIGAVEFHEHMNEPIIGPIYCALAKNVEFSDFIGLQHDRM